MKKYLAILLLSLSGIACYPVSAGEAPKLSPLMLNKHYLFLRTWKHSDTSIVKIVKDWHKYLEDQTGGKGFTDKKIIRRTQVLVNGVVFDADYRVYNNDGAQQITLLSNKFGKDACSDIESSLNQDLGTSTVNGNRATPMLPVTYLQWDIGQTRITYECLGSNENDSYAPLIAFIDFEDKDHSREILPTLTLICSMTRRMGDGQHGPDEVSEQPPLKIILDQNEKKLFLDEAGLMGTVNDYSSEAIDESGSMTTKDNDEMPWTFHLDRETGAYRWHIDNSIGSQFHITTDEWGTCEKVTTDKKI